MAERPVEARSEQVRFLSFPLATNKFAKRLPVGRHFALWSDYGWDYYSCATFRTRLVAYVMYVARNLAPDDVLGRKLAKRRMTD